MTGDATTARAISAFGAATWPTRAHIRLRAATCPIDAIDRLLPTEGDVVDVGCGHGLTTIRFALRRPGRSLRGVDIDPTKLDLARAAASAAGVADRVRFDLVDPDWLPEPASADAVVVVDVLYLLDRQRRADLLGASAAACRPGGVVVVKETARHPAWKRRLTIAQEHVSVKVTRITAGTTIELADETELRGPLERAGLVVTTHDLSRGRPHPHLALVAVSDARL